jgi:hypothetical protein
MKDFFRLFFCQLFGIFQGVLQPLLQEPKSHRKVLWAVEFRPIAGFGEIYGRDHRMYQLLSSQQPLLQKVFAVAPSVKHSVNENGFSPDFIYDAVRFEKYFSEI